MEGGGEGRGGEGGEEGEEAIGAEIRTRQCTGGRGGGGRGLILLRYGISLKEK